MKHFDLNDIDSLTVYNEFKESYESVLNSPELEDIAISKINFYLRCIIGFLPVFRVGVGFIVIRWVLGLFIKTTIPSMFPLFLVTWALLAYYSIDRFNEFLNIYNKEKEK